MNILFVLKTLSIGGVEVVTSVLANKFVEEGHGVSVFSFLEGNGKCKARFDSQVAVCIGDGFVFNQANVESMRTIISENKIDVIINQWGLPLVPIKTIQKAIRGTAVKVITMYHSDPLFNGRIAGVDMQIVRTRNWTKRLLLQMKKSVFRFITSRAMHYNYQNSDWFLVLSASFISHFKQFAKVCQPTHIGVQTNPITIPEGGYTYQAEGKIKEVIYVGRLENSAKRPHRVIDTWKLLETEFPDWTLTFVGDGDELANLQRHVNDLALKNVRFVGYATPVAYYERASIIIQTSQFEGFPLILPESMSRGVIPCVYGSFPAVYDILDDGKNGYVIRPGNNGFEATKMADKLRNLMSNAQLRNEMAELALEKSKLFSIDIIYNQWLNTFRNLGIK